MHPSQQQNNAGYFHAAYSSHYAQAYMQSMQPQQPNINTLGYAPSSVYIPIPTNAGPSRPQTNFSNHNPSWYQPGQCRCTYKDCTFTGSRKSLEIHRMDRHLIYPPGWDKQPKKADWDADPSLKGKPIPIQGTNMFLDTPEQVEAWITERKRRWPSKTRVEDKKRKLDEAIARGQLTMQELGLSGSKRRRIQDGTTQDMQRGRGHNQRGQHRAQGRGAHRSGSNCIPLRPPPPPEPQAKQRAPPRTFTLPTSSSSSSEDSDSDGAPEAVPSKMHVPAECPPPTTSECANLKKAHQAPRPIPIHKPQIPQPRRQPFNPFAAHTGLLRNLLLPEIRVTVSNLSQAIRFLVDNNFLEDVELQPGGASSARIEVLSSNIEADCICRESDIN